MPLVSTPGLSEALWVPHGPAAVEGAFYKPGTQSLQDTGSL